MSNYTKYNPILAWRTVAANVIQLTREDVDNPSTYRITVAVIDTNDVGQGQKDDTCFFTDNSGTPYKIIATSTSTIDVLDVFKTGLCPVSGKEGWVHKSAYKGYSHALPANLFWNLHRLALQNNYKYSTSVLWGNDPNPIRIPFINTSTPSLINYQQNYSEDYGENPKLQLFTQNSSNVYWLRQEVPIFNLVDGLLDSIVWDLSDSYSGYIIISR